MAKQLKAEAKRGIKASEAEIASFAESLDSFLRKNLKRTLKKLAGNKEGTALEAAKLLGGLKTSLEEAGLQEQLSGLNDVYGNELDRITALLERGLGKRVTYSEFDVDSLETLISFDIDKVSSTVGEYVDDVRSTLMKQVILGESIDVDSLVDGKSDEIKARIDTELNTAVAGFSRAINQKKAADAGANKFLYEGPDDGRTRPFCAERVGKIFTLDEIKSWDNDQGLPAEIYLGGWNCRHRLLAMSDELASELNGGDNTGQDSL